MRKGFGIEDQSSSRWFALLASRNPTGNSRGNELAWTPETDRRRRDDQFRALKEIRAYLRDAGIDFPLSFCPGGSTVVEYFSEVAVPDVTGDNEAKRMFRRRDDGNVWKDSEAVERVRRATEDLLDAVSLEAYFEVHPPPESLSSGGSGSTVGMSSTSAESEGLVMRRAGRVMRGARPVGSNAGEGASTAVKGKGKQVAVVTDLALESSPGSSGA